MSFVKNLLGGILVAFVAAAIAVAQNAVRKDGIPLVPGVKTGVVGKQEVPAPGGDVHARSGVSDRGPATDAAAVAPPVGKNTSPILPSEEERASGLISGERIKELLQTGGIVLMDARPTGEYEAGHIPGAISVPYERFSDYYAALSKTVSYDATIVCYCQGITCDDSENLARELKFMGYANVLVYKGGWDEWSKAGDPDAGGTATR
jgi:rhodanese-related sulfurtransferase